MKNRYGKTGPTPRHKSPAGFSLVELMVAMAVFLVIGGAAVSLVKMHVPLFTSQQSQTGLNLSMRNGVAQMQIDVVNAGTGFYQGVNIPTSPIGLTVVNSAPGTGCFDAVAKAYSANCFDTLNVVTMDLNTPPSKPWDIIGGINQPCVNTFTSSNIYLTPIGATTLSQLAGGFKAGDQILLIKSDGSQVGTTTLTTDGTVSGGKVLLTHNVTAADGTNNTTDDPLQLSNKPDSNKLGIQFCGATDWVMKLAAITYKVDATDPTDPKLIRVQGGVQNVIAEQIIGFKVGAAVWNGATDITYSFDASTYNYDFSLIRAVRVSMIGRTPADITNNFRNSFDNGAYKIESVSVVINPRNLSMND
jgi:prepilin-type N-terminal cleavage/methylation domain-containing protein